MEAILRLAPSHQFDMLLQIIIKKLILGPLEGLHKFNSLGFFFGSFTKKIVKSRTILRLIFIKRIIYRKLYLFNFYTKMTNFPFKVMHVSPNQDVWIRLAAKYLHIDIFDQNLKKVWIFCVWFLYVLVKFSPLFGDHRLQHAGKGSRRFRGPRQWSHWWETEQKTRGLNQDCYVSEKSKNV